MGKLLKELFHRFILKRLKAFNAYCDKNSEEVSTGVNKRKYKLAFNVIRDIQIYPFFVLNSKKNFSGRYAFKIKHKDWAKKSWGTYGKPCLSRQASYIDVRKMEILPQEELYKKMKSYFEFFWVGKLKKIKREELKNFCNRVKQTTDVRPEDKGLLLRELTGDDGGYNVDDLLDKYKI